MTEPNKELLADETVPRVTLGGKDWPMPKLSAKQNAVIIPVLKDRFPEKLASLAGTTEGVEQLYRVVFTALQRGHKSITREEFDDMPIGMEELLVSMTVIAIQTGMYKRVPNGVAAPATPLTEATSSPTSAG